MAICTELDGLPLAIELAAGRSKLFTPEAMLSRLHERLSLFTGGPRDRPGRQPTFRAALDWSYTLLAPEARRLLAQLSIFTGSIDPEAAAAVSSEQPDAPLMLEQLAALQETSLLEVVSHHRLILSGILWVIRSGCSWREMPAEFGPWETVHGQYTRWRKARTWQLVLDARKQPYPTDAS